MCSLLTNIDGGLNTSLEMLTQSLTLARQEDGMIISI